MNIKVSVAAFLSLLLFMSGSIAGEKYSVNHEKVRKLFQSDEEKTAKDAVWTARDIFKVGVISNGARRDGYAQYVCSVLNEHGFKGKGVWVQIIDISKLSNNGKWIKLGEASCK